MSNDEIMAYCKNRYKTYAYHRMNLKDVHSKEEFSDCIEKLLEDIHEDNDLVMDIEKIGNNVPKPVAQALASVQAYSDNVMDFYCRFKLLKNF